MSVPRDVGGGGRGADLLELARSLRQELLYVSYEKKQLQNINEAVASASRQLAHSAWIAHQQRENLEGLVMSRSDCSPSHCCQRANLLLQTGFIDAYKQLQHHQVNYTEFLVAFRNKSKLVAACLAAGDKIAFRLGNFSMSDIVVAVFSGLFGSCLLPEDEAAMIDLLHNLMDIQLLTSANPRKLLRHGNCSFSRLYKVFSDQLFSSKLFLTSALHEPILYLLTNDEIFLDIDPEKAVIRFRASERLRKFGKQGTPEYDKKVKAHRQEIISKLVSVTNRFISGIRDNLHCFPPNLARLLRYLYRRMTDSGRMEAKEVNAVCVDVLFTLFIFPAIVDPEPMGIIDMPISYIARFNLMQVAQMLQVLALWKWEEVSPNLQDLYSNFDRDAMPGVLETLLDTSGERHDPSPSHPSPVVNDGVLSRLAVLLTGDQLHAVVEWLRAVRDRRAAGEDVLKELEGLLAPLPPAVPGRRKTPIASVGNHVSVSSPGRSTGEGTDGDSDAKSDSSPAQSFGHRQKAVLAAKLSNVSTRGRATQRPPSESQAANNLATAVPEKVLILPVTDCSSELPGLASEESVIKKSRQASGNSNRVRMNLSGLEDGSLTSASGEVQEKRTRFSLSHDDGSIGNASDNLEAISEAASNHSVASSLEDEVDQGDQTIDNMSDMVSANVSGRGTPNVSGRDTPSSQVTEEEEPACDERAMQPVAAGAAPNSNVLSVGRKNGEPDMEEKFGRFEIKPEVRRGRIGQLGGTGPSGDRDEAVSMVSDTWSTDVLSSDTETVGEPPTLEDLLRGRPGDEFNPRYGRGRLLDQLTVPGGDGGRDGQAPISAASHLLDVSETGSEAWSMDVLASDTESLRLADLDLEDGVSVARSDDTRFTDDTTRSDPADNLQREDLTEYGGGTLTRGAQVGDVPRNAAVEQWAELSRARNAGAQQAVLAGTRRDSDGSNHSTRQAESILKKPHMMGIMPVAMPEAVVCLDDSAVTDGGGSMIANVDASSVATSVRLSTTSIASSASSHGSVGSADVLPLLKSRSNSSGGTSVSGIIGEQPLMPESSTPVIQAEVVPEPEHRPPVSLAAPGPSTGAIPKSISFDKSADKEEEGEHKYGVGKRDTRSFFKSWKLPKISRRGGGARGSKSEEYHRSADRLTNDAFNIPEHDEGPCLRRAASDDPKPSASLETSDDILAKYRKKQGEDKNERVAETTGAKEEVDGDCDRLSIDPENVETSFAFQDAQRKLRLALSEADLPLLYSVPDRPASGLDTGGGSDGRDTDVVSLLKFMLAEAHNQQDRNTAAQLHETLRCVAFFDQDACNKILRCLRADYQRRSPYIAYLVRSRNGLLSTLAHLERLNSRMESDQKMCSKFLISVCVRLFLEKKEEDLQQLLNQFSSASLMDEKAEMVVNFLEQLWSNLEQDNSMLAAANPEQMQEARVTVERAIFSQIYMAALYPNQEADAQRDLSLQEHISKLSNVVSPGHKDIKIPKRYHYECPWPSAQAELRRLAAFKLPSDKVACIARVATTIMNLLCLAAEKSVPAADDFLPVLVFVIIKANPPGLLSTVQFVDNFYGSRLSGEDCYWWMQFVAAIEFIKTMDYKVT